MSPRRRRGRLGPGFRRGLSETVALRLGGPERARVILSLAAILALSSADGGTIGAVAPELRASLRLSNTDIGLLTTASAIVAALAAMPAGMLTDRVHRVRLVVVSILVWVAAMALGGAAPGFEVLLLSRLALGVASATAGPVVASLSGDFFPAAERGRIYGYVLSGELVGAGVGLLVGGNLAGLLSWRFSFAFLALAGLLVAWAVWRYLPEPQRGGRHAFPSRVDVPSARRGIARRAVEIHDIAPAPELILRRDPARLSMWRAGRYIMSIPTNVELVIASAVGYFFFAGLRTFAVEFTRGQFGIGQSQVTLLVPLLGVGALAGVLLGGRLADWYVRRGRLGARIVIPALAYAAAALAFLPGVLTGSLLLGVVMYTAGAGLLGAANPPLDAARLDIMHFGLWGRAESVRTLLRTAAEGVAPLLFGLIADQFGGSVSGGGGSGKQVVDAQTTHGLRVSFLIMLIPLFFNGVLLLRARRGYPRDVATALASEEATTAARSG
jgi:predicted MFS family arabinose efflux permease